MARKSRQTAQQRTNNIVKNAVTKLIKNISVIAIFASLGLILLLYLGPEIHLATKVVFKLAVPSVLLAVSITIVNELWIKNGQNTAFEEEEYQILLKTYAGKSDGLNYDTLQSFLDYEYERRYNTEYDRLTRIIEREQSILNKMKSVDTDKRIHKLRIRKVTRRMNKIIRHRDNIVVSMPYEKSEEFDYLKYNIQDIVYKEYSPNDTRVHLKKARVKKYISVFTFSIVGLNALSIGGSMGDLWVAIIMTSLASVSLIMSVVKGFSIGYHNIKVVSTGVYRTANSFIDQAVAYCKRNNKDLYYKGDTDFREYKSEPTNIPVIEPTNIPVIEKPVEKNDDIFTKAAIIVAENDYS